MAKEDISNKNNKPAQELAAKDVISNSPPKPTKTPFYQATNALRYQRQAIIHKIGEESGSVLICYISGNLAWIDRDDIVGFAELLHNIPEGSNIDLMLHTLGGDIDAAEKLITLVRKKAGTARLRVIVPDCAKSAGTLISLGADSIVMSDTSELGPIDPQIILADQSGNRTSQSVQSILDAYDIYSAALNKDPGDATAQVMLNKLNPATIVHYQAIMKRAKQLGEDLLQQGMFKEKGNWSGAVSALLDTKRWLSHAQMISWEAAADKKIGLTVEYLKPTTKEWASYWQLYCLERLAVGDSQKLFESEYASMCLDISVS